MITGTQVTLRPLDRRHLELTRAWANDPELSRIMDRALPVSEIEHEHWSAALGTQHDRVYFAVETNDDARHVGNVWLWQIDCRHRKAEVRVVIGAPVDTGRGLGVEAISLVSAYAFERLNLHKVYAYVVAINPRAQRAFEKAGFAVEGVLQRDRWIGESYADVYLMARLRP